MLAIRHTTLIILLKIPYGAPCKLFPPLKQVQCQELQLCTQAHRIELCFYTKKHQPKAAGVNGMQQLKVGQQIRKQHLRYNQVIQAIRKELQLMQITSTVIMNIQFIIPMEYIPNFSKD